MKQQSLAIAFVSIFFGSVILLFSCKKLNDATGLGAGLIPEVDNITTFDTTLDVLSFVDTFSLSTDSTRYLQDYQHYLGVISNDPFFGKTDARIYLELKPNFYKYTFSGRPDSLHIDSIVLVLDYVETYGDTNATQTVNVYEIAQSSNFFQQIQIDSGFKVRVNSNINQGQLLGTRSFEPRTLNDTSRSYQDTVPNQLRIKLDNSFGQRLLTYDTVGANSPYSSDTAFKKFLKGFAVESVSGNAIIGINLDGANTKLAIYYKDDNGDLGNTPTANWDTAVAYFNFNANALSGAQQFVKRDYAGTPLAAVADGVTGLPDDVVYIQSAPGSFATIKIPGLSSLNNRIVHRAELIMEQIYDVQDSIFSVANLYLDAYDPAQSTFRTIPYDVQFDFNGNLNLGNFGVTPMNGLDQAGRVIKLWKFNLSRYVQHIVNGTESVYDLRVHMPFYTYNMYQPGPGATSSKQIIPVNSSVAKGRVRLHGGGDGSVPGANPQRMRLRIIYSKI